MIILAIDPGPTRSAWLLLNSESRRVIRFGLEPNETVLAGLRFGTEANRVVIEKVESFGMAVGAEVFETVFASGQMAEAARLTPVERMPRRTVKLTLCGSMRAKDTNIRQELVNRYSDGLGEKVAKGTKAAPGPLYGIANDVWSALAIAVTYAELHS